MQFSDVLRARVSTRDFLATPVPAASADELLQAALYAPVGMHKYETLHLSVITDKGVLERIRQCAASAIGDAAADPLHGAPLLIVVSSSQQGEIGALNVSCMIQNMLLAATDLGLGNLYVRGAIVEAAKDRALVAAMKVPDGFTPMASVAVGYAREPEAPRTAWAPSSSMRSATMAASGERSRTALRPSSPA